MVIWPQGAAICSQDGHHYGVLPARRWFFEKNIEWLFSFNRPASCGQNAIVVRVLRAVSGVLPRHPPFGVGWSMMLPWVRHRMALITPVARR